MDKMSLKPNHDETQNAYHCSIRICRRTGLYQNNRQKESLTFRLTCPHHIKSNQERKPTYLILYPYWDDKCQITGKSCLFNRIVRLIDKKASKLRIYRSFVMWIYQKWKVLPCDNVIVLWPFHTRYLFVIYYIFLATLYTTAHALIDLSRA